MKIVKVLAIIVISFFALLLIIPIFLPSELTVEVSMEINKPASMIYPHVADYQKWNAWSVWATLDKNAKYTYDGTMGSVGSKMSWVGDTLGIGHMEIMKLEPNKLVESKLVFEKPQSMESMDIWTFEDLGQKTKVTWKNNGKLGYPMGRIFGLLVKGSLKEQFHKGISSLKSLVEKMQEVSNNTISIENVSPMKIYYIEDEVKDMNPKIIQEKLGSAYGELMSFIGKNGLTMAGVPMVINVAYNDKSWKFQAAIPPNKTDIKPAGRIKSGTSYGGKAVRGIHIGPYEQVTPTYMAIESYMKQNKLEPNGMSYEVYVNDPTKVTPDKIETHIYYPIK